MKKKLNGLTGRFLVGIILGLYLGWTINISNLPTWLYPTLMGICLLIIIVKFMIKVTIKEIKNLADSTYEKEFLKEQENE